MAAAAAVNCNLYKALVVPPGSASFWNRNLGAGPDKISARWRGFHPGSRTGGIHAHALRFVDEVLTVAPDQGEDGSGGNRTLDLSKTILPEVGNVPMPGSDANMPEPGIPPEVGGDLPPSGILPDVGGDMPPSGILPEVGGNMPVLPSETVEVPPIDTAPKSGLDSLPDYSTLIQSRSSSSDGETNPFASAGEEIKDAVDNLSKKLSEIQADGTGFFDGIKESITGSITRAEDSIKDAYDNVNGSVLRVFKGTGAGGDEVVDHQVDKPGLTIDWSSPFRIGTPINNALKEAVTFVGNGVGAVGHSLSDLYSYAKGSAPVEVQTVLNTAEDKFFAPAGSILHQAFDAVVSFEKAVGIDPDNPIVPVLLVGGGTAYLGFLFWDLSYGGYSGDLSAKSVFDMLKKEKVVLVDVRQQELKERDGVPDLRRGARFKFASISGLEVERSVRNLLISPDAVDDLITATLIRNLKNVTSSSKVVVMDADGTQSKKIAKALKKLGLSNSYRLEGGFAAWIKSGLPQKPGGRETPLQILKEETEAVVDDLKPVGIAAIALGSAASIYALSEWEKTLQLLGVIAIIQLIYLRFNSYQTAEELNADLRILLSPFRLVIGLLGGQSGASKLELATSPSTTAVQDRVVQAAAKHGSKPDDEAPLVEQEQDQEQEIITNTAIDKESIIIDIVPVSKVFFPPRPRPTLQKTHQKNQ